MTMLLFGEFLNKMTNLNPGITLVQDPAGGSKSFRHTLQSILLLRGLVYSALIFLLAWPLAWMFKQQDNVAGFMAVALLPLVAGCIHVDVFRHLTQQLGVRHTNPSMTPEEARKHARVAVDEVHWA